MRAPDVANFRGSAPAVVTQTGDKMGSFAVPMTRSTRQARPGTPVTASAKTWRCDDGVADGEIRRHEVAFPTVTEALADLGRSQRRAACDPPKPAGPRAGFFLRHAPR